MIKTRLKYQKAILKTKFKAKSGIKPKKINGIHQSVLCYHGLVESEPKKYNSRFITVSEFEKHLNFFKDHQDIEVVSIQKILKNDVDKNKLNIAITFDDGYLNNLKFASPLLEKYEFPATFCVNNPSNQPLWTDSLDLISAHFPNEKIALDQPCFLGKDKNKIKSILMSEDRLGIQNFLKSVEALWLELIQDKSIDDYWKRMNFNELKDLAANSLFTIVPHGSKHLNLVNLTNEGQIQEIQENVEFIKTITQSSPDIYSSAFGNHNQKTINILNEMGIEHLLAIDKDEYGYLHRLVIHPHIPFGLLKYFFFQGAFI